MPWKECSVMDERLQFVARRLGGEGMAELCREFGISRKTGYKIFDRYQECGVEGLARSAQATSCLCGRISASMATSACKLWRSREMVTIARVRPPFLYATAQSRASRLPSISIASHFSAWPT